MCLFLAVISGITTISAQVSTTSNTAPLSPQSPTYADFAHFVTSAPLVIKAQVINAKTLKRGVGGTPPPGFVRMLVSAQVGTLIRGEGGLPPRISYLADVALNAAGRVPKLRKQQVLLFALPGKTPDTVQLLSRHAQMEWRSEREAIVRAITTEVLASGAAPPVSAVGDAFHVTGTVAGESETQIFLKTQGGGPVSLSIIRRPDQAPHWGVSLGEVVDEAAVPPSHNTLLWYRLACGLPRQLPPESVRTLAVLDAEAVQRDYAFVLEGLGTCERTL
ncbi:hypothetical protein [Sphingobium subterraneum]|uniref:Uncharacterized protein n=1 Tax=Sphingobium subterraneum TaxID=627688 RepID=A0A841J0Q5_9SPHN|nr:hypothetical protein [Sphingobium subterraneum]MBB6124427.1 hypothetical protein [Sphingobium subterraneum]